MLDYINKVVTIVLVFLMLVIAPLTWVYVRDEMITDRLVLNEIASFIDRVTDKASINEQDLDDLYIAVNATGGTYDVKVKRYVRTSVNDGGEVRTVYIADSNVGSLNTGDVVKVTVKEVGISPTKRLLWSLLRIDMGKSQYSLAGSVR